MAESGLPAISPHRVSDVPVLPAATTIWRNTRRNGRPERIEPVGDAGIAPIDSHDELEEIIGADGDEIHFFHQFIELPQQAWHFEHGAELQSCAATGGRSATDAALPCRATRAPGGFH